MRGKCDESRCLSHREMPRFGQVHRHQFANPTRPRGEHEDVLAEERGLINAVGDKHDRRGGIAPDTQQFLIQPIARDFVQRPKRLVHQQNSGLAEQSARDRDPLTHAAR